MHNFIHKFIISTPTTNLVWARSPVALQVEQMNLLSRRLNTLPPLHVLQPGERDKIIKKNFVLDWNSFWLFLISQFLGDRMISPLALQFSLLPYMQSLHPQNHFDEEKLRLKWRQLQLHYIEKRVNRGLWSICGIHWTSWMIYCRLCEYLNISLSKLRTFSWL